MTDTDTRADLVIHARRIDEDVLADPRRFGPAAADLIVRARRAHEPEALVLALRAYARAQRWGMAQVAAKRLLDEAYRIAHRHGLDQALADVLISRAAVNQELGRLAAAARDLDAAGALVGIGPPAEPGSGRGITLAFQRAVLAQNIGRLAEARAIYRDLLANPDSPPRTQVLAANNLALIEAQHGRYAEARRRLERAARLAAELGPTAGSIVGQSLAWVTVQSGRLTEGLRAFAEAARVYESANLPLGEHYVEYADALMDLRLIPEAITAARRAEEEFRAGGVPLMGAEAALRLAQLALLGGDPAEAEAAAQAAADSFGRQGRWAWRARAALVRVEARLGAGTAGEEELRSVRRAAGTLERLGMFPTAVQAYLVAGRIAAGLARSRQAQDALARAERLARGAPVLVRLRGHVAGALAARLSGRDDEGLRYCRRGLADLARHRSALPSVELRALASGHGAELGHLGLEVVVRAGSPGRVLDWMERTRAAGLLTVQPPHLEEIKEDLDALRAVHAELEALAQRPDGGATVPGALLAKQLTIESRIRRATWQRDASLADTRTAVGTPELRRLLDGRILVEYGALGGRLLAVVLEARRSRLVPLGTVTEVQEQVRTLLFALRRLAQPRPAATLAGARLSADLRTRRLAELLLEPLGIAPDAELVVVPVGPLHAMPWSALHAGPLSLAPSATFWAHARQVAGAREAQRVAGTGRVALVAGPNLPGAGAEVAALSTLYPHASVLAPPDSTAEVVASLLDGADLAHLACHGRLRGDNPMFSSLMLSDGPLTVQELETRGVAPYRMVLASCRSGADVLVAGDEVLGFVSALLARGTAGIVASVAAIPDVEAVDLMCALHDRLARGGTLARALHEARGSLDLTQPGAYVNWCAFSAHGAA